MLKTALISIRCLCPSMSGSFSFPKWKLKGLKSVSKSSMSTQNVKCGKTSLLQQQQHYGCRFVNYQSYQRLFKTSAGGRSVMKPKLQQINSKLFIMVQRFKLKHPLVVISCVVAGSIGFIANNSTVLSSLWHDAATDNLLNGELFENTFRTLIDRIVGRVDAWLPGISHFNFIADVVEKAGPAVVFLEVKGEHPESGRRITLSNGSGFIVRPNGLILTSAHVVANKTKVIVKLHDGDVYEGTVTAVDPVYDLATIKIEATDKLPALPLGKSSEIRPGEFVVAMGSPLSLNNTVTSGIVSSSLRGSKELGLDNKNMQYIQTDAVISFGNSGGPLVNLDGNAIGINNLKITSGISFAIPSDYAFGFLEEAERIMEKASRSNKPSYIASGKESRNKRRFMGISMLTLTPLLLNELKDRVADFPHVDNGVYVHKVIVGSPAYEGGIHAGDIIVEMNGNTITSTADIYRQVELAPKLNITAVRGNYLHKINVTTEELF